MSKKKPESVEIDKSKFTTSTVRTFKMPDDLYIEFEFVAKQDARDITGGLVSLMRAAVKKYREQHPETADIPFLMTEARRKKLTNR